MDNQNIEIVPNQPNPAINQNQKKSKFKLFIVIGALVVFAFIILAIGLFSIDKIVNQPKRISQAQEEAKKEFQSKFGINSQIDIKSRFIYFNLYRDPDSREKHYQLIASDALGKNITVLRDFKDTPNEDSSQYGLPSPKGSYYVQTFKEQVMTNKDQVLFDLPRIDSDKLRKFKWSSDEKYLAGVLSGPNKIEAVIYDIQKGQEIFRQAVSTSPSITWSDDSNDILYVSDGSGIKIIKDLDKKNISIENFPLSETCGGIAQRVNEFYCVGKMTNLYANDYSGYSGSVRKYTLLSNNEFSQPEIITPEGLEGEYDANLYFLDNKYLLFMPVLGGSTIIDVDSGKIAESYAIRGTVDHSSEFEIFSGGNSITYKNDRIPPTRYFGN